MYPKLNTQRGSALVIAVFIIVVALALALSLARLLTSGSQSVVYEVQGTRTLFAAQSALELSLPQLFPLNGATTSCAALTLEHNFSGDGLAGCSATVSCSRYTDPTPGAAPLYRLNSNARCVAADFETRRTVQIEVR